MPGTVCLGKRPDKLKTLINWEIWEMIGKVRRKGGGRGEIAHEMRKRRARKTCH
jgi:hypothetical protein